MEQSRPRSLRYPNPGDRETDALEKSKTGTTKSWFRFNSACVKLSTHLTKRSFRGNFALLADCCNLLFRSSYFLHMTLTDVFTEESNSKGLFKETEKEKN